VKNINYPIKTKFLKLSILALAAILVLLFTGCSKNNTAADSRQKAVPMKSHSISKKEEKRLIKDLRADFRILNNIREDTSTLREALSGHILTETINRFNEDAGNNRIKIRQYGSPKFILKNYTKGVAGVTAIFIDRSYYIDKNTGKKISKPTNKKTRLPLAAKKVKGHWKLIEVYTTKIKK